MFSCDRSVDEDTPIFGVPADCSPHVSIVIPTYKRPYFLRDAIESVLSQNSCLSYELIVVDNDQSRSILDVVRSFSSPKMTVYQNSHNIGIWGNIHRALDLARGEWILILCDDDLLLPNAIRAFDRIISSCKSEEVGCLAGGAEILLADDIKPILKTQQPRVRFPLARHWYSESRLLCVEDHMVFSDVPKLCSSFFRREYIKKLGGWDAECHGDADLALFLRIQRDKKLFTCMHVFGCFRVHMANESHRDRLWSSYPIHAAHMLLSRYVDETTSLGAHVREMVEKRYTTALWKSQCTDKKRRAYAGELLRLIVQKPSRRFLLKNTWLLNMLGGLYANFPC